MPRRKKDLGDKVLTGMLDAFAVNLRDARKRQKPKKMTQQELATKAKLHLSTIIEIEGKRAHDLRFSTLTALAQALKMDPVKLLKEPSARPSQK